MDADEIADLFAAFVPVTTRRLFGGRGLYAEGLMFAIAVNGIIYLKADPAFAAELERRGSAPFSYEAQGAVRTLRGFWSVREAALDEAEDLAILARRALMVAQAAAQARAAKPARKSPPRPKTSPGPKTDPGRKTTPGRNMTPAPASPRARRRSVGDPSGPDGAEGATPAPSRPRRAGSRRRPAQVD